MEKIRLTCPCLFGVESVLAFEVKRLGVEDVEVTDGRVSFTGTPEDIAQCAESHTGRFLAPLLKRS